MRPQPRSQQRPESFEGVDVHFVKAVAIVVAGVLAMRVAYAVMFVALFGQPIVDVVFIGVDDRSGGNRPADQRTDGDLLYVGQHLQHHRPGPLQHSQDWGFLFFQGAASPRAFQPPATPGPAFFFTAAG